MRIRLCILSCAPDLMHECVETALGNAAGQVDVFGFYNGGTPEMVAETYARLRAHVRADVVHIRTWPENKGVPAGLHALYESVIMNNVMEGYARAPAADEDILVYVHDDLNLLEPGWDQRVANAFAAHPRVGLVSFGGSTALGAPEIYRDPYEIHQLGRRDFYSNMNGAEAHGTRTTEERPIVSTDGMSMVLRRSLLDAIGGWSWIPPELVHHAYDYAISCMNRRHGFEARLVPVAIHHKGGLTAGTDVHKNTAAKYGGDGQVHADAHRWVYENFRDCYPLRLK